jgi:peptide/nickel transport system substrate-binding protein
MRSSVRARFMRIAAAAGLTAAVILPAATPAAAVIDDKVLRLGTTQAMDSTNPYQSALVESYEAFELSWDQLVGFGPNLEPQPAYATSWERAADGNSWTFKFRPDMKWSDGQPATSEDACFSWQLNLDAIADETGIGLDYLTPGIKDAGVTKVECPDPETMIVTTSDPSNRVLQTYVPILPKHIYGKMDYKEIGDAPFAPPADGSGLVGSGPYQLVEYKVNEFARFKQNPNFRGQQGAPEEIVMQFFSTNDTLFQALKQGEVDYVRKISPEQFKQLQNDPEITAVNGTSNGWTELGFNAYGSGTGNTIKGGGPSTKALQDPAFRDALGYAIDKQRLVDNVIGGLGTIGSTQIPPVMRDGAAGIDWHKDPATPRTFDIELAKQKLDAAGYKLNASGQRLDKEGKPISLKLVHPDYDPNFAKAGQFIKDWFAELGINVTPKSYESGALVDVMLPPEAGSESNKADYDMFIWTWSWGPDPNDPLGVFLCDAIGGSSDSLWCDPEYDRLYQQQLTAKTPEERKAIVDQMQDLWYQQAPYHILYYDDNLHAYRSDKWAGWQKQPDNGTPLFSYGTLGYTLLTDAKAAPSTSPSEAAATSGPGASGSAVPTSPDTSPTSSSGLPIVAIIAGVVAIVAVGGFFVMRRNRTASAEDDE